MILAFQWSLKAIQANMASELSYLTMSYLSHVHHGPEFISGKLQSSQEGEYGHHFWTHQVPHVSLWEWWVQSSNWPQALAEHFNTRVCHTCPGTRPSFFAPVYWKDESIEGEIFLVASQQLSRHPVSASEITRQTSRNLNFGRGTIAYPKWFAC